MTSPRRAGMVLAVVAALTLTACTAGSQREAASTTPADTTTEEAAAADVETFQDDTTGGGEAAAGERLTFAVVTHGSAGDPFWDVVKTGAETAGEEQNIQIDYQSDGDPGRQAQLIESAISSNVDGLVVSMANPDALREPLQRADEAGIPVVTINSGADRSREFGALTHVGQSEIIAGQGAGDRLLEAGVTNLVCVIHEAGNIGLEQRCQGAAESLGAEVMSLQVNVNNISEAETTISTKLRADTTIDGVLTLNPAVAVAAVAAIDSAGSTATLATFDLNEDVVAAIKEGEILFAVDQQQYLQGYLPVVFLALFNRNANTVGGGRPVLTGPGYVTQENADTVEELAAEGTR